MNPAALRDFKESIGMEQRKQRLKEILSLRNYFLTTFEDAEIVIQRA